MEILSTAQQLADSMGIQWGVWTVEPASSTIHGQAAPFTFYVALAQVGDAFYEIIQPLTGDSIYLEHLNSHGEGFHHTCVTYGSLEDLRQARDDMLKQGREMLQSASMGEAGEFYYFAIPETGSILEVLYLDPESFPPTEKTIG